MKITISKSQWEEMGKKAGWMGASTPEQKIKENLKLISQVSNGFFNLQNELAQKNISVIEITNAQKLLMEAQRVLTQVEIPSQTSAV